MAHKFRPRIERLPTVTFDSGTVQLFTSLTKALAVSAESVNRRLDRQAAEQGRIAGIKAGATGSRENVPTLQDAATIRGRAFNQAAITTFTARLESTARQRINDMFAKNADNPAELEKSLEAYQMGVSTKLATMIPEVGAAFDANFPLWAQPFINKASNIAFKKAVGSAKQAIGAREAQLGRDLLAIGADLSDPDPNIQTAAMNAIIAQRAAIEVVLAQTDPRTGAALFAPDVAAIVRKRNDDAIKKSWVRGWYGKQKNKSGAYLKWRRGLVRIPLGQPDGTVIMVDPRADFDFKDSEELDSFMKSNRDIERTIVEQSQALQDKLRKRTSEELVRQMSVMQVRGAGNIALNQFLTDNVEGFTAAGVKAAQAMSRNANVVDDPTYIDLLNSQLDNGIDIAGAIALGTATGKLTTGKGDAFYQRNRNNVRLRSEENPLRLGHSLLRINFGRDAEFSNKPQMKLALNFAGEAALTQFDNWIEQIKTQRDGNLPNVGEVTEKVRELSLTHLPPKVKRAFFNASVERPDARFQQRQLSGDQRGFLDVNLTNQRIWEQILIEANADLPEGEALLNLQDLTIDDVSPEMQQELLKLQEYQEALDELMTLESQQTLEGLASGTTTERRTSSGQSGSRQQ